MIEKAKLTTFSFAFFFISTSFGLFGSYLD